MRLFGVIICAVLAAVNLGFGVYYCLKGHAYLLPINLIGVFWGLSPMFEYMVDRK